MPASATASVRFVHICPPYEKMHLVHLDEVKYERGREPYYWLCGLAFPEEAIRDVERRLSAIAQNYFKTAILSKESEFHAAHIVHGKGVHRGHTVEERLDLFLALIDTIDECPELKRIEIRMDPARMKREHYADMALMFFVERVDALMRTEESTALLIADHDAEMVSSNVTNVSAWKQRGTDYQFGREINFVVDTIHHTHSHHSRLIQLTDVYTYTVALASKLQRPLRGRMRGRIVEYAESKRNLYASKYKHWPPQ